LPGASVEAESLIGVFVWEPMGLRCTAVDTEQ